MVSSEKTERSNTDERITRLAWATWLLLTVLVVVQIVVAVKVYPWGGTVKAKAFHLVGEDGNVLVRLSNLNGNGAVFTHNAKGERIVTLGAAGEEGHGMVVTRDAEGRALARISAEEGKGFVGVYDPAGNQQPAILKQPPSFIRRRRDG